MKVSKPIAFVVLAFMIGAIISQGSFAFADDSATNPFRALWEAIGELQTRTDSLQAQIDEIKTQGVAVSSGEQVEVSMADTTLELDFGSDDFQTLINVVATNGGDDSAVGVKILTYYQMSILDVTFIDGAQCTDQARGIVECYVGTIESGGEEHITIYATPSQLDEQAIVTADVSSITKDADPTNNHAELVFITSEEPEAVEEEEQEEQPDVSGGSEEQPSEESSEEQTEETSSEEQTSEEQPAEEQSSEEQTGEEQPAEGEQGSEEQTGEEQSSEEQSGEQSGEEGSEEQSSGEEGSESGGEESSDQGGESSSDQGSESGGSDSSDSGSSDSGSDSGDSGSDGGSGDSGDSGSDGGSDSGGSDSGGSDGGSGGDGGSSGGDSGGESG